MGRSEWDNSQAWSSRRCASVKTKPALSSASSYPKTGKPKYNDKLTRSRKAKAIATIHASVLPVLAHFTERVRRVNERRKRKEKEMKPKSQLPGCREDSTAPSPRAGGKAQRRSVFLRFMRR